MSEDDQYIGFVQLAFLGYFWSILCVNRFAQDAFFKEAKLLSTNNSKADFNYSLANQQ